MTDHYTFPYSYDLDLTKLNDINHAIAYEAAAYQDFLKDPSHLDKYYPNENKRKQMKFEFEKRRENEEKTRD